MEKSNLNNKIRCAVVGGSAGSLKVIMRLVTELDPGLDFPVIIVLHRRGDTQSLLEEILNNRTTLTVKEAEDKEPLISGHIYIAPADYHLLVEKDHSLSLDASEKVMWSRPSIDVTFESAAESFGKGTLGILLSGANNDGTAGLEHISRVGGTVIIQDPDNAEIAVMPAAALEKTDPDYLLPDTELAAVINRL